MTCSVRRKIMMVVILACQQTVIADASDSKVTARDGNLAASPPSLHLSNEEDARPADDADSSNTKGGKRKKKKKGMSKHLMIMWVIGAVLMMGGLGYLFWKLRVNSGKLTCRGTRVAASARRNELKRKKEIKEKKIVEKEKLKDKKEEPLPLQDPAEARRRRRQAMEERAKAAAEAAFIYGMFDGEAVDYREDRKAERLSRAAIFERRLQELGATLRKEVGARGNEQRQWWGSEVTAESESTCTFALPLRLGGLFALLEEDAGELHVRVTLPAKYPAVAVHVKLTCSCVSPAALEHLRQWTASQVSRMQGKAHVVELLDALYAHAERRLSEFDVNDWSAAEQERLEAALRQCTPQMRLRERMVAVAALVQGKTPLQCASRCKFLKSSLVGQQEECSGVTNIYPGTGDDVIDGVGQHAGMQVRVEGMVLGGCSVAQVATARVLLCCERCGHDAEAGVSRTTAAATAPCAKCAKELHVRLRPDVLHANNSSGGYLDIEGASVWQLLPSDFWVACGGCGSETKFLNVRAGTRMTRTCRTCYSALSFGYEAASLQQVKTGDAAGAGAGGSRCGKDGKRVKMTMPDGLLEGTPLPDKGACKHFRRSRRWLCFPCCGRAYACPVCHDERVAGDHTAEWATRMICGSCSREQPLSNKTCVCGADPSGTSSGPGAHWAGGEGMRDRTMLDKKDRRHISAHFDAKKTTSKKKGRVGEAGKQAREKKKLVKAKTTL